MKVLSKLSYALLAAMLAASLASTLFCIIFENPAFGFSEGSIRLAGTSLATVGYFIIVWSVTQRMKRRSVATVSEHMHLSLFDGVKYYLVLLGGTTILSLLSDEIVKGIVIIAGVESVKSGDADSIIGDAPVILIFICVVVISPIFEELLFRKVLLERLLPYGNINAIGISSLLFGLYHGNFEQVLYAIFMGVICANIVIKTGKIKNSIYMHMAFNLFGSLISGYIPNNMEFPLKSIFMILAIVICVFCGKAMFILPHKSEIKFDKFVLKSEIKSSGFILLLLFFLISAIG